MSRFGNLVPLRDAFDNDEISDQSGRVYEDDDDDDSDLMALLDAPYSAPNTKKGPSAKSITWKEDTHTASFGTSDASEIRKKSGFSTDSIRSKNRIKLNKGLNRNRENSKAYLNNLDENYSIDEDISVSASIKSDANAKKRENKQGNDAVSTTKNMKSRYEMDNVLKITNSTPSLSHRVQSRMESPKQQNLSNEEKKTSKNNDFQKITAEKSIEEHVSPYKSSYEPNSIINRHNTVPLSKQHDYELEITKKSLEEKNTEISMLTKQILDFTNDKEERIRTHAKDMKRLQMEQEFKETEVSLMKSKISSLEKILEHTSKTLHSAEVKRAEAENDFSKKLLLAAEERTKFQTAQNERFMEWQRKQDEYAKETVICHREEIQRITELHTKEVNSMRKRISDGNFFDSLAKQINESASVLQIFEAKWKTVAKDFESRRSDELDAREVLLTRMEQNTQESQKKSEFEASRLQKSICKMDDFILSIQNSQKEENLRFEGEHNRLMKLQTALFSEREQSLLQINEEKNKLSNRWVVLENEQKKMESKHNQQNQQLEQKLSEHERMRKEFEGEKAEACRSFDFKLQGLKEREENLSREKQKLRDEIALFNQRRESARNELDSAEATRLDLNIIRTKLEDDQNRMTRLGEELSNMNALVSMKDSEADNKLAFAEKIKSEGEIMRQKAMHERSAIDSEMKVLRLSARKSESDRLNIVYEKTQLLQGKDFLRQVMSKCKGNSAEVDTLNCNQYFNQDYSQPKIDSSSTKRFSRNALMSIQNQISHLK